MAQEHSGGDDAAKELTPLPELRWLRRLVTVLAVGMVLGIAAIAAILWLRLSAPPLPQLPPHIALPRGEAVQALTFARNFIVVVTDTGRVLVYDPSGTLQQDLRP